MMRSDDLVMLYSGPDQVDYAYLSPETAGVYQNKHGSFQHRSLVGKAFGTRIRASNSDGWVDALAPTPELWASAVRHRTQIVHQLDAAVVCFELGVRRSSVCAEAGTGSGAMTGALSRSCGSVHTYEFNEARATAAQGEFERNGLTNVTVRHCDVCEEGFRDLDVDSVDAVFLDLPEPWRALPHALRVAKPGARIATYSPCVEQVHRTRDALSTCLDLRTLEVRQRDFVVKDVLLETGLAPPAKRRKDYQNEDDAPRRYANCAFLAWF
ncbi:hypothetical protein CTAYLR_009447 [Chrysophaeum taylorii]|uniref:tRNA (adenine(58)-N(1))-methyltransferase n=1 Tax=Chrysophaeum taylorii TaxID=2483200 RepID=A0AAD7U987_9STRA|nr:hypothetical protein CTAYLR_009447 [Chrysophaeum taylorii]